MEYKEDPQDRFYLLRGKERGRRAWHCVMVQRHLLGLFLKRTNGGSLDLADVGTILKCGWGEDPPQKIRFDIPKKVDAEFEEISGYTLLHLASRYNNRFF